MPIYEYECRKCGSTIEAIQKMSDPDLKKHAGCGGTLTKLLSIPAFQVSEGPSDIVSRHPSVQQQKENQRKRSEAQKKAAKILNVPKSRSSK